MSSIGHGDPSRGQAEKNLGSQSWVFFCHSRGAPGNTQSSRETARECKSEADGSGWWQAAGWSRHYERAWAAGVVD